MKRCIASVYALSIGGKTGSPELNSALVEKIPALIEEINRQDLLLNDPWIEAYIKAKAAGSFIPPLTATTECVHTWSVKERIGNPLPDQLCDNGCGLRWGSRESESAGK